MLAGADGKLRCAWSVSSVEYERYHDEEWGRPVAGENELFERICLEAFQSGLSWITILRKREAFRRAFAGFDAEKVARFGSSDVECLMQNAGIIRNRAKIAATVANAKALLQLHENGQTLAEILQKHAVAEMDAAGGGSAIARVPATAEDVPAITAQSRALAAELKQYGFRFVGPTTAYAMMQATGIVNDHLAQCWVRDDV